MRSPEPHVVLAPLTTLGVGGPARWFAEAQSVDDVRSAYEWARSRGVRVAILAGGSNIVVSDEGFDGLVIRIAIRGIARVVQGSDVLLTAGAGEPWDGFVARAVAEGLGGVECLSGIPGTVGGTPIQNVGAYGQDVSETIVSVTVFDVVTSGVETIASRDCGFAYRRSRFKVEDAGRFVVCEVAFRLTHSAATATYPDIVTYLSERGTKTPSVQQIRDAVLAVRRRKGMVVDPSDVDTRSVGSFFTNPVVSGDVLEALAGRTGARPPSYAAGEGQHKVPAAWLLERAGFGRGYGSGHVGLSSKHPLAIVNRGGATAAEVVAFAATLKQQVEDRFGISLVPEPIFLGFDAAAPVAYLTGHASHVNATD